MLSHHLHRKWRWDVDTAGSIKLGCSSLGRGKIIYTTNAIEGVNAQLAKNTSIRRAFLNDYSIIKILLLNIANFTKKWTQRHEWDRLTNQLSVMFLERLAPEKIGDL